MNLGLSQKGFARIVGIDSSLISRYERNEVRRISLNNILKIIKAFPQYKVSDILWISE